MIKGSSHTPFSRPGSGIASLTRAIVLLAGGVLVLVAGCAPSAAPGVQGATPAAPTTAPATVAAPTAAPTTAAAPTTVAAPTTAATAGAQAGVPHAQALIAQWKALPKFQSPGPAFDARSLAGKTIFSLPSNTNIPFIVSTDNAMKGLAEQIGLKYVTYPNSGQTSEWVQGMNTAIASRVDVINLLNGTNPERLQPQIIQAKNAGIPTVDSHDYDLTQPHAPNLAATVDGDFVTAGQLVAAYAIADTGGNANVLIITSNNYSNSEPVSRGMMQEFQADCPSCKITTANVNGPDWATQIQPTVIGAIQRDPGLNYVLPVFDSMAQYVVPAVIAANAVGRVHAASFNGTPAILDLIRTSNVVTMDVGENTADIAAAALDQCMRVMAGLPPSQNEYLVLRVFDKDNINDAGNPAQLGQGYGNAWLDGYRTTWKLQ